MLMYTYEILPLINTLCVTETLVNATHTHTTKTAGHNEFA